MTAILFDATKKTSQNVTRKARFAAGLLAYIPQHTFTPYTTTEADEAREMFIAEEQAKIASDRLQARRIQIQAAEAEFRGFYEAGLPTF